jgi:hypothetical protein
MSIPVHNLYDFVHQTTKKQFFILYFSPWGSRELKNIRHYQLTDAHFDGANGIPIENRFESAVITADQIDRHWATFVQPILLCHDQEPLNYNLYLDNTSIVQDHRAWHQEVTGVIFSSYAQNLNLRTLLPHSLQKKWVLLHSELNSQQLDRYEQTGRYIGAYWWSHAAIARDWYRFAEYDQAFCQHKYTKLFLTYCRDTTGSRAYRQDFLDLIKQANLIDQCQISSIDPDEINSDASAIYNVEDFNATAISVVLETVFDSRIHLTEKTLRAIACGHPFILAAGPGSLKLLRSYGFHTFTGYINESYDDIYDNQQRLKAICAEMTRISRLPTEELGQLIATCQSIAEYNKKHFFSDKFFKHVTDQLDNNVRVAFDHCPKQLDVESWYQDHKWRCEHSPDVCELPTYKNFSNHLLKLCQ